METDIPSLDSERSASNDLNGSRGRSERPSGAAGTRPEVAAMLDVLPFNVLYADTDLVIRYANPRSVETLKKVEHLLPVRAADVVGQNIDIFHKNPSYQRRILADRSRFPHKADIKLGDETLELSVQVVHGPGGAHQGFIVAWDLVTERRELEAETERVMSMMANAPFNVLYADRELRIQYANPKSIETLKKIEHELPIRVDQVVGQNIDIFHKEPQMQRRLLADDSRLPHNAQIKLGEEYLDLLVSAVRVGGEWVGTMVTWDVITEDVKTKLLSEERMQNSAAMNQVFQAVAEARTTEEVTVNALRVVRDAFGWAYGSYWRRDYDQNALVFGAEAGTVSEEFRRVTMSASFREGVGLAGRTWARRDLVFVPDLGDVTDCVRRGPAQRVGVKSGVCIPLLSRGDVIGTLDFFALETIDISDERLDTLRNVGKVVSAAFERIEIAERTANIVRELAGNADNLATSSDDLLGVSQTMGATAEETAQQATVVSAAADEVSQNVQTVAAGVEELSASVKEIAKNATTAATVATEGVDVASATNQAVAKLGESSAEIGKVIKVITSIAQQTNLLALNATIEAARAGEAGKGFGVVANEVKELAKETAKATEDISQKIEAIQGDTTSAVAAIDRISGIINQVNDIQATIAAAVREQNETTNEISRSIAEAARGSAEIADNITAVADAARSTTTGASDTQGAANELGNMAAGLKELVHQLQKD